VDFEVIRRDVSELAAQFDVQELAYDPWQALQLANQLDGDGVEMVQHRQGFGSMAGPTATFQRLWSSAQLAHDGDPVLAWMADNVAVKEDEAGNLKPDKKRSGDRVDGIVAAVMAVGRMAADDEPGGADDLIRMA